MTSRFLSGDGLGYLVIQLDARTDNAILSKIVNALSDASTNQQIPGAAAVYSFVTEAIAALERITMTVVADLPATGETGIIYLVPVDDPDHPNRKSMHSWIGGAWVDLGYFEVDLSEYWAKNELVALTNAEIDAILTG